MPSQPTPRPNPTIPTNLTTPQTRSALLTHLRLLHLLHHRNRNQHRRSLWYRHFSSFRRQLRSLCEDLALTLTSPDPLDPPPSSVSPRDLRAAKKLRQRLNAPLRLTEQQRDRIAARLRFWREQGLAGRWFAAFSQVVADGQYAPLGLVLVGVLARVAAISEVVDGAEDEVDMEMVVRGKEAVDQVMEGLEEEEEFLGFGDDDEEIQNAAEPVTKGVKHGDGKAEILKEGRKRAKRRRRLITEGDDIDALFAGL